MRQRPHLQLIAPQQIRLLKPVEVNLEPFQKGDIVTIEEHDAERLIESKHAEKIKASDDLESVNRFVLSAKEAKAANKALEAEAAAEAPKVVDAPGAASTDTATQRVSRTAPAAPTAK
jgi:NMD protein affecting ribosome stability and mRNA decay